MKVDILTHGDPQKMTTKRGAYLGGGVEFVNHLVAALKENECDVEVVVGDKMPRLQADILFLATFGVDREKTDKGRASADKKWDQINQLGKPMVVSINSVDEFRIYAHSLNRLKDVQANIVIQGSSRPMIDACNAKLPDSIPFEIAYPFVFDNSLLKDKTEFSKVIISPARIASQKGTAKILDIAARLDDFEFKISGLRSGVYWYYALKNHPHYSGKNVEWLDAQPRNTPAYSTAGYSIDMTSFWWNRTLEGERAQYTTLESINHGCIPITWMHWNNSLWHGINLPSPKKIGAKFVYDLDDCVRMIREHKYSFEEANDNFNRIKAKQSHEIIGKQYIQLFRSIL